MTIDYRSEKMITIAREGGAAIRMTRTADGYRLSQGTSWLMLSAEDLDAINAAADELDDSKPLTVTPAKYQSAAQA